MDQRKVTISPEELARLKDLLREEELRVDAMETDEELLEAEMELEAQLRSLTQAKSTPASVHHRDDNWQKIQARIAAEDFPAPQAQSEAGGGATVHPLRRKNQQQWGWLGAVAAAALALFVLYPATQEEAPVGDPASMQTKGIEADGIGIAAVCTIKIRGGNSGDARASADGLGFILNLGESFQIFYSCDRDGYLQVWNSGHPALEFRDVEVKANQLVVLKREADEKNSSATEGDIASFELQASDSWDLSFALTEKPLSSEVDLLDQARIPEILGGQRVMWADSIAVKGIPE